MIEPEHLRLRRIVLVAAVDLIAAAGVVFIIIFGGH